jgi:hypothetical protein
MAAEHPRCGFLLLQRDIAEVKRVDLGCVKTQKIEKGRE